MLMIMNCSKTDVEKMGMDIFCFRVRQVTHSIQMNFLYTWLEFLLLAKNWGAIAGKVQHASVGIP